MAAGELRTGSNSLGFRAAVAHDNTEVSARAGVTTPIRQHGVMASGQPEVFTPATITTPTNITAGTEWDAPSGAGSVFVDGKRRIARANYSYSADGNPAIDELVLEKAKRRAAIRNLDNPAGTSSPGNISSALKLPMDNSVAKLKSIGIYMGSSSKEINVSFNSLK